MKNSIIALGLLATAGCAKFQAPVEFAKINRALDDKKPIVYTRPQCEVDHVDYILDADILSYEFVSKNQAKVGFNLISGFFKAIGLDFNISQSQLVASMKTHSLYAPGNPDDVNEVGDQNATESAKGSEVGLKGSVDFSQIGLGFEHYSKTPVSKLTLKGLEKTFASLAKKMLNDEVSKTWMTRVISVPSDTKDSVIIQVGAKAGVQKGDVFTVTNTLHRWANEDLPCQSVHYSERPVEGQLPIQVEVVDVGTYYSEAVITDPNISNEAVMQGAKVEVAKLSTAVTKKRTPLGRAVWVRSVDSQPLKIDDKNEIDLETYAIRQIQDVISMEATKNRYYTVDPHFE